MTRDEVIRFLCENKIVVEASSTAMPLRRTDCIADVLSRALSDSPALAFAKVVYFSAFPDERESRTYVAYWQVRPTGVRASDDGTSPTAITVIDLK